MQAKFVNLTVLAVLLICQVSVCPAAESSDPNKTTKYLDAVRTFADNVLKYGRDTYGPKHTPLFVDGLNIHTHEPVKWIAPNGDRWILSNLASQQTFFRTLVGLTAITGDPKYKQAAMDAIKYAFENLRSPNGLLYWGSHVAYDALTDEVHTGKDRYIHKLTCNFPYYELMWQVDSKATKQLIENFWSAHILDWSNLDMNRHGPMEEQLASPWKYEYEGGPVFFKSRLAWSMSFWSTGSDLFFAGSMLSNLSGEKEPLIWSKRLARRYVETRNPRTGISAYVYSRSYLSSQKSPQDMLTNDSERDLPSSVMEFPAYGRLLPVSPQICQLLLGQILGSDGGEFREWAIEELTAWGKFAYRKSNNSWVPMLIDGTSLEGYVVKRDSGYGLKGTILKPVPAGPLAFWAYALAFGVTGDEFMWEMTHGIALGNNFGDIDVSSTDQPKLGTDTDCSDPYALLGFLELYARLQKKQFLKIASRIGDNILSDRFHAGFFVPSKEALYTKFDYVESLALLHLDAAVNARPLLVPQVWPSISSFSDSYYGGQTATDTYAIYSQTRKDELTILLLVAAWSGNTGEVETLISKGVDVNTHFKFDSRILQRIKGEKEGFDIVLDSIQYNTNTPLHYAAEKGHKEVSELLIAKGADINARNLLGEAPLHYAVEKGHKEIAELLIRRGADVNARNSDGDTSLHSAVANGYKDIAELLIVNGVDINAKNKEGLTPVDIALDQNHKDIIELLLEEGVELFSIHLAVYLGDIEKVKSFIETGTSVNGEPGRGHRTPLYWAVRNDHKDVADLLIEKGADVSSSVSLLYYVCMHGHRDLAELFIQKGADVNSKNWVDTPSHYAVWGGHVDVLELLLIHGADASAKSSAGWLLLHDAAGSGSTDMTRLLLNKGADVNVKENESGQTPLHRAAGENHTTVAELLIANGADINAKDNQGRTPLQYAQESGHTEIAELLRKHGAKE